MISAFPVIRNPTHLLRFLGLSGPDAPDRVAEMIQCDINLLPWLLSPLEQTLNTSVTPGVGVVGLLTTVAATVPANQRWLVTGHTVFSTLAAAHTYRVAAGYQQNGLSFKLGLAQAAVALEAATVDGFAGRGRDGWLLLAPGDALGVMVESNTGAAPSAILCNFRFTAFQT